MAISNPTKYVTTRRLGRFKEKNDALYAAKSTTYTKTEVDQKISDVDKRFMVSVSGSVLTFTNSPVRVQNRVLILD